MDNTDQTNKSDSKTEPSLKQAIEDELAFWDDFKQGLSELRASVQGISTEHLLATLRETQAALIEARSGLQAWLDKYAKPVKS